MPIRKYNPTSPGRRFQTVQLFDEVTTSESYKPLTEPLRKSGGRNNRGEVTSWWRGGGHKRNYRIIDFKRDKRDIPATVATVEYDPNRSARIALLTYADGEKRYILQPLGLKVGRHDRRRRQRRHPAGQCAAAEAHSARHRSAQRRAEGRQGRTDRPQRRLVGAGRRQGWRVRLGQDAVGRDSQDSPSTASRRSARSATSTTRTSRSARPAARAGWASGRTSAVSR